MDSKTFVIIGASGQLGKALLERYPDAVALTSSELDITNQAQVDGYDWSAVSVIFNAAAYTNVDGAETPEGRVAAWSINAVGTANLARVAQRHSVTLVHVSTDFVFDGSQETHSETEPFSPLGVYAQSKAAGDIAASTAEQFYVLRTSWLIGAGKNFVQIMLGLGQRGIAPSVIADHRGRPSFTTELVRAIDHLLTNQLPFGTYNVSNSGDVVSWAELTRAIFQEAGYDLVVTDTTNAAYYADKPGSAPRPLNSALSLDKLAATGFVPTDWREDLTHYIAKEATT
ncbi:MAG: dTDP-4-dehydrorhamnose reductase [Candidatus Saccharibacteria bacterium]|nr:dTDP-4-dehydrorhamnose reductase [Candidatus Saccharibacteria bacterium]